MISLYNLLPDVIKKRVSHTFFKYAVMAILVVSIEIVCFWLLSSVPGIHYLIATNLSLLLGILLNWAGSRYFVFGASHHKTHTEFMLVLFTSLVGILLQSLTVFIFVDFINSPPVTGKLLAIVITFFWNYFVRQKYIFKSPTET